MNRDELSYENLPDASHEAVHAARNAAQALEVSRQVQAQEAADMAVAKVNKNIGDIMQDRLEHVLARGTEQEKSIILARVPFICQDIRGINGALAEIKDILKRNQIERAAQDDKNDKRYVNQDQFSPFKWALTVVASVFITTIVGALLASVIIK